MLRRDWIESLWYKSSSDGVFFLKHYRWVRNEANRLLAEIDVDAFKQIGVSQQKRSFNTLYLDLKDTLIVSLYRLRRLRLHEGPPLAILDIGTGPGVFPYVCQRFGHRVLCTDVDATPYFNQVTEFLKLDRRVWRVQAGVPSPDFGRRFDLATATNVGFNVLGGRGSAGERQRWFIDEWDFFLGDLARRAMNDRGRIYVTINQLQRRTRNRESDKLLLAHFAERGAVFPSHGHVLFEDSNRLL